MRSQYNKELDEIREAIVKTFSGAYGEKVLNFLDEMYSNQISAVANDPYSTYYNEGGRGLVLGLKAQIKAHKEGRQNDQEWSESG